MHVRKTDECKIGHARLVFHQQRPLPAYKGPWDTAEDDDYAGNDDNDIKASWMSRKSKTSKSKKFREKFWIKHGPKWSDHSAHKKSLRIMIHHNNKFLGVWTYHK